MALHSLCSWEDNGYHDSYFYDAVWNDETNAVERVSTGATAWAGGITQIPAVKDVRIVLQALDWLANHIYGAIRDAEYRDVLEPQAAPHGTELELIRDVKHKGAVIKAGTWGDVFWSEAYGTFYRNGYNKPCRENIRVGLRLPDGSKAFVALKACKLKREPMSDAELLERATRLAEDCKFGAAVGMKAWESSNAARALYESWKREQGSVAA